MLTWNGEKNVTEPFAAPESPAWSPASNPGGISQNDTVGSSTTLAGGTYYFTALTINATLQFSGPATLYVNGDIDLNGAIKPTSLKPAELTIYQIGSHTFGDSKSNNMDIVAVIIAPDSDFVAKNSMSLRGSAIWIRLGTVLRTISRVWLTTKSSGTWLSTSPSTYCL